MKSNILSRAVAVAAIACATVSAPLPAFAQSASESVDHFVDCSVLFWTDPATFKADCGGDGKFVKSGDQTSPATKPGDGYDKCYECAPS